MAGNESGIGGPVSITYVTPLVAPSTPSTSTALSGGNVVATSSTASCISTATTQYKIDLQINDGTWTDNAWGTSNTLTTASPQQGTKYDYRSTARCVRGAEIATSGTGAESPYVHPISTPSAPTVTNSSTSTTTTWTSSIPTCPTGTTAGYRYQYQTDGNWVALTSWYGTYTSPSSSLSTTYQGYQYTRFYAVRCQNTYATSSWSSTSQGSSYIRPVATPGAPYNFSSSLTSDRLYVKTNYTLPTCGPGTTNEWQYMANWDGSTNFAGSWAATGLIGYAPPVTQTMTDSNGNNVQFSSGTQTRIQSRSRCVNTATNRMSGWGPVGMSDPYTVP